MKKLSLLTFVFALTAATLFAAEEPKVLRVGIAPVSPPMQYTERNKIVGLEADFAQALGKELGRPVVFVDLKFRKLIPALLGNEIDIIMSGMSITQIRSLQVAYAKPYLKIGQMALVRSEDRNQFNFPSDIIMTSKNIGVKENTTGEYLVVQEFPNAKKSFYPSLAKAASALKSKKVDMLIMDSTLVSYLAMKNEGKFAPVPFLLTEENLAWGMRKSDKKLLEDVNDVLEKWKETGQLDTMLKQWVPGLN